MQRAIVKYSIIIIFALICKEKIYAQEIIKFTVEQAEKRFLEKNLELLAERYNIDIADAAIIEAKLLNNPTIGVGGLNFWNPNGVAEEMDFSPATFGKGVVFSVELEQMITTAGKRRKLVNLEKMSKEIAVQEFEMFLLGLKTELRTILNETIYLQSYIEIVKFQQETVNKLVEVYKTQSSRGNIPKSELIRLQSSLIELESETIEIQTELNSLYKELKILLNISPETNILILGSEITTKNPNEISLIDLLEKAKNARPEFLLSDLNIKYNEKLLVYEKSQRVPDIALSLNYDRYDGLWRNFVSLGVSFDIPIFNRNQGNIKMAKIQIEQSNYYAEYQKNVIQQEIIEIYNKYKINYDFYKKIMDNDFSEDLENMFNAYSQQLLNRNINMLEYLDFMEAYKTTKQAILTAKKNLDTSFAELEFSVNGEIK